MDKKNNLLKRFTFSINPKKYVYLYKDKISSAFLYVILLSIILGLISGIASAFIFSTVEETSKMFLNQEDTNFEMKDGILDFKSSPLKEEEGSAILYIDTTKTLEEVDELRSIIVHKDISTVLLSDGMMIKSGSEEITYKYSDFGLNLVDLDNEILISMLEKFNAFKYIMIPIMIIAKFVQLMIYALFISLFGVMSNLMGSKKVPYGKVFSLSIYALTVPSIITTIYPIGNLVVIIGGILLMFGLNYVSFNEGKEKID